MNMLFFNSLNMGFENIWQAIMFILGGLGIFLFGIHMMSGSLKELAGDKLKLIIQCHCLA